MSIKEDVENAKKEIAEIKEESFAMELIKGCKQTNKRLFTIIIVILGMWFATIGYLVWLLNDIQQIDNDIEIQDVEQIDNSHIKIGDDIWELSD